MRGPLVRIKYDVRRLWRCPQCGYECRAGAEQTSIRCHCEENEPFMQLVEDRRTVRPAPAPCDNLFEFDETDEQTPDETDSGEVTQSEEEIAEAPAPVEPTTESQVVTDIPADSEYENDESPEKPQP